MPDAACILAAKSIVFVLPTVSQRKVAGNFEYLTCVHVLQVVSRISGVPLQAIRPLYTGLSRQYKILFLKTQPAISTTSSSLSISCQYRPTVSLPDLFHYFLPASHHCIATRLVSLFLSTSCLQAFPRTCSPCFSRIAPANIFCISYSRHPCLPSVAATVFHAAPFNSCIHLRHDFHAAQPLLRNMIVLNPGPALHAPRIYYDLNTLEQSFLGFCGTENAIFSISCHLLLRVQCSPIPLSFIIPAGCHPPYSCMPSINCRSTVFVDFLLKNAVLAFSGT